MTGLNDEQVKSAFRYRADVQAMMADPDLTGDTLLLGLAMLNRLRLARENGERTFARWDGVRDDLGWTGRQSYNLELAFRHDIPRYEVPGRGSAFGGLTCGAPMIRRDGICNKPVAASLTFTDRDPVTGAGTWLGFCSRHGALQHDVQARNKDWAANGRPEPPHNAGGALARYFDGLEPMYVWANHGRELTPGSGKPAAAPKPTLTLIRGGAA